MLWWAAWLYWKNSHSYLFLGPDLRRKTGLGRELASRAVFQVAAGPRWASLGPRESPPHPGNQGPEYLEKS